MSCAALFTRVLLELRQTSVSCPTLGPKGVSQDWGVVASHASMLDTRKHMRAPRAQELDGEARCTMGSAARPAGGDHNFS